MATDAVINIHSHSHLPRICSCSLEKDLTIKIWEYTDTPAIEDMHIEATPSEQANEAPKENIEVAKESTEIPSKESTEAQEDTTITEHTNVTTTDRMDEN
ncbi:hypothetical protein E3Q22_02557 [Wallemia mellicola]|uniref:WD40 repeat-like protein n=1 Tax=Wallemia mellicola TaxID=1708541 RepID=A0A4V4MRT0_9BASI|nr:hypothetical protein E3Q24_02526 [Wallemia mellicola]TIB78613.1 hypothetical protein E3Q22_02557 [Wallemia mellicola]TIC00458.1 hypothetical protein E3Q17_02185 [Wallemia mellicola]TIC19473.1 hypothetical protein E3Q13_01177 [Wallemia mellicola]TIC42159.1 hypothetical protein E3Q07_01222 [Wallemia mellicola]